MPAYWEADPFFEKSRNCGEDEDTWFTMRSATISTVSPRARTSSHVPKARIHLSVINRVKSGIRAINRREKRQQVHSAEDSGQRPAQQAIQFAETTTRKAVNIRNKLNLVFQTRPLSVVRLRLRLWAKDSVLAVHGWKSDAGQPSKRAWRRGRRRGRRARVSPVTMPNMSVLM